MLNESIDSKRISKISKALCVMILQVLTAHFLLHAEDAKADYSYAVSLDGPPSEYSRKIVDKIAKLVLVPVAPITENEKKELGESKVTPLQLECYETPQKKFAPGVSQKMIVKAPFAKVAEVIDDFESYSKMFIDLDSIKIISKDQNKLRISWEQNVPLPLVPDVEFDTWYILDSSFKDRKIYRYQLAKSDDIIYQDGFIMIEKASENETRYIEYDFWDAHWGAATTFAPGRIWTDSIEGIFLSDVLIKLRAERAKDFTAEDGKFEWKKMKKAAKALLDAFPVESCIKHKKIFTI